MALKTMKTNFSPFPTLKIARLVLRALELKDAQAVKKLRSDVRVNEFIERPDKCTLKQAKEFIKKIQKGISQSEAMYWVISFNNVFIGTVCLYHLDFENDSAEIGYELNFDAQGNGFMNETIKEVIDFAFKTMCVKTITAFPKQGNVKSIQLLEKNNFVLDKTFKFTSKVEAVGYLVYFLKF